MRKNGFTLIELLGTITIIGLLLTIATFSVVSIMSKSRAKAAVEMRKNIEDATLTYAISKKIKLSPCESNCNTDATRKKITLQTLIDEDYFKDEGKKCDKDSQITITMDNKYNYIITMDKKLCE